MRQEITFYSIVRGWVLLLACLTLALFWSACQTTPIHDFSKVVPNMNKDEVLNIIGSPSRTERFDGKEKWAYKFWTGDGSAEALRQVTFVNGRVVSASEDFEEEERLKEIQEDDSKRAERRKQAKVKVLGAGAVASPTPGQSPDLKDIDPPVRHETESDFIEQKGKRGAVNPEE